MLESDDKQYRNRDVGEMTETSTTLLGQLRAQDDEAWRRMVRLYGPLVYRWCRLRGANPDESHDLVQQVYQAVAGRISDFRHDRTSDSFRGWLYRITENKVKDWQRSRQRRVTATGGSAAQDRLQQVADLPETDSLDEPRFDEIASVVHRAAEIVRAEFSDHYWQAFWKTTVEGRYPADVAYELGISRGLVYQAKSRVLRALRNLLDDLEDIS